MRVFSWHVLPEPIRKQAHRYLLRGLMDQGFDYDRAFRLSYELPRVDLTTLAISGPSIAEMLRVHPTHVARWYNAGRLPCMLDLRKGDNPSCRAYWLPVARASADHREETEYKPGRGRRWEWAGPTHGGVV